MSDENQEAESTEEVVVAQTIEDVDMGMSDEDFVNTDFDAIQAPEESSDEETEETDTKGSDEEESANMGTQEASEATEEVAPTGVDYESEYNKIMAEFKANGKMMSVDNSDDVRQLMKMGAGYNKKMAGMKSHQKIIKMLENNELLDESKLNYLIDLDKKNPDAIAKLIKDSGVDTYELSNDTETEYTPNTYNVNDKQVQLDSVLEDLQESSGYTTTVDIVGNKWDVSSRQTLVAEPELIRSINGHVENGIYDQIVAVVEKEKMLGKLQGMDDFTAYRTVGDAMEAQGVFRDKLANAPQEVAAPSKRTTPSNVNDKKRAAGGMKEKSSNGQQFSIESMSDDEFEKRFAAGLN
jgi:hypothetical protein